MPLIGYLLLMYFASGGALQSSPNEMTVCQLMSNLKAFDGQVITVKGFLVPPGPGQPFELLIPKSPETCYAPGTTIMAKVDVAYPEVRLRENPPEGYKLDGPSVLSGQERMEDARRKNPTVVGFNVVLEGLLRVTQYGPPAPGERRFHAWLPAHLVIQRYKDIEIQ